MNKRARMDRIWIYQVLVCTKKIERGFETQNQHLTVEGATNIRKIGKIFSVGNIYEMGRSLAVLAQNWEVDGIQNGVKKLKEYVRDLQWT